MQDRDFRATHNTPRSEIHIKGSDLPAGRPECNISDKALPDFYSSMREQSEYLDSTDQAKYFYQHRE